MRSDRPLCSHLPPGPGKLKSPVLAPPYQRQDRAHQQPIEHTEHPDRSSPVNRADREIKDAVGPSPVATVLLWGRVKAHGLLDTGSMVSFVTADFFRDHIQPRGNELMKDLTIRLTAANGLALPYDGYFNADITLFGQTVKDVIFLVLKDSDIVGATRASQPCLIGMNILKEFEPWSSLTRGPDRSAADNKNSRVGAYVRVAQDLCIPAATVLEVKASGPHPSATGSFIIEPLPVLIKETVFAVPVRAEAQSGLLQTLIVNLGDSATTLKRRTVIGLLSKESPFLMLFGREPHLPLDLLTKNPAPEEYTSTSEYLSLHLERLRKVHQLALARTETAAKKRERPAHTVTAPSPELGDKVLLRQHLPGRVKIQDRYRDQVYQLTERPSDGSPAVIAPMDDLGNQRRVTFRELRPLVGDSLTAAVLTPPVVQIASQSQPRRSNRHKQAPARLTY